MYSTCVLEHIRVRTRLFTRRNTRKSPFLSAGAVVHWGAGAGAVETAGSGAEGEGRDVGAGKDED